MYGTPAVCIICSPATDTIEQQSKLKTDSYQKVINLGQNEVLWLNGSIFSFYLIFSFIWEGRRSFKENERKEQHTTHNTKMPKTKIPKCQIIQHSLCIKWEWKHSGIHIILLDEYRSRISQINGIFFCFVFVRYFLSFVGLRIALRMSLLMKLSGTVEVW